MLSFQGIWHVVALQLFFHVIEQYRNIGTAFQISEAQCATTAHEPRPMVTARYSFFPQHFFSIKSSHIVVLNIPVVSVCFRLFKTYSYSARLPIGLRSGGRFPTLPFYI